MPENSVQVYATHRRWDPWYHFFAFSVVSISFFVALWAFIKSLSGGFSVWAGLERARLGGRDRVDAQDQELSR